jgi:hypothetical protein
MSACTAADCTETAVARVGSPQLIPGHHVPGMGFLLIRPAAAQVHTGLLLCLDHAHHAVDLMLLRDTPEPAPRPDPPTATGS